MSAITLLDGTLKLSVYYEESDRSFDDSICLSFEEDCLEDEKIFKADVVSIYLTPEQVALLILELNRALDVYRRRSQTNV